MCDVDTGERMLVVVDVLMVDDAEAVDACLRFEDVNRGCE